MTQLEELKQGYIADINLRQENQVIEKNNADLLIKLIKNADSAEEASAIATLGTLYNKTGLTFDVRLEKNDNKIKYLQRNTELSFTTDANAKTHKLIIGDNYPALLNLLISYKKKIDVIYIDPPYGCSSMGEFAITNYENQISRDNLLSMLYPRLMLAKQLLTNDGLIFCSIDDKNQAYIKCLFDEVFGEENFIACCPRKTAGSRTTKSDHELQVLHDYLLIYSGPDNLTISQKIIGQKTYPYKDDRGIYYLVPLQDNGPHGTKNQRPNLYYPIYEKENGDLVLEKTEKVHYPAKHKNEDGTWMWSKDKFLKDNKDLTIHEGTIKIKHYYVDGEDTNKYQAHKSWLADNLNAKGTKALNNILGESYLFANPKPVDLVKWCIELCPNKNAIILDFFAGSGTTGQSVLELNQEDNGNRQFILCTNNEKDDKNINGIAYDITAKRMKRIMTGKCYDGTSNFAYIKENKPLGDNLEVLDIVETENFIQKNKQSPFELIDETVYGKSKFTDIKDKIEWICKNFDRTQKYIKDKEY